MGAMARAEQTWIVVAAYNEEQHITDVVKRVRAAGYPHIVVADDGSKDRTAAFAKRAGAAVVRHIINLGKGAALKTGADYAVSQGATRLVFIDGDGQHRPEEIPNVLARLRGEVDMVFTYRRRTRGMPLIRRLGGLTITTMIRLFYSYDLKDALCGMRAMTAAAYRKVRWTSRDYSVESEMIANAGIHFLRTREVEISTIYHDSYKGMTVFDGLRTVWHLMWWRMMR